MPKLIFCMKRPQDINYDIVGVKKMEFPITLHNNTSIILFTHYDAKSHKTSQFEFNLTINGFDNIKSIDDIKSITLSRENMLSTKNKAIEDTYEYWLNVMTKRLEEIQQLRIDRLEILEKLDHHDENSKDDVSIQDVDLITQQIKNHTSEVNNICMQNIDVEYNESVEIKHIDLICGLSKRIELKEFGFGFGFGLSRRGFIRMESESTDQTKYQLDQLDQLFDVVWYMQDYDDNTTDVTKSSHIEIIEAQNHVINIPKIRQNSKNSKNNNILVASLGNCNFITGSSGINNTFDLVNKCI